MRLPAALVLLSLLGCGAPGDPPPSAAPAEPAGAEAPPSQQREQRLYSPSNELDQLRSLPYAEATFDPESEKRGVLVYDEARAFDGLNFYSSRELPAAFLVDMEGQLVYQWRRKGGPWQHVELLPDGDVLVLVKEQALFRVNLESDVLWRFQGVVHHDHGRAADGRIFVLTRKREHLSDVHPRHAVLVDYLTVLSEDGEKIEEVSVLELFRRSRFAFLLPSVSHRDLTREGERGEDVTLDFLHTNHVEVLDGSHADRVEAFAAGNVLISMRHMNTIAVADLARREVVWAWGPTNLTRPHHPTVIDNGNLLIFNNGVKQSAVVELDPATFEVVWRYKPGDEFFSSSRGSNQRLPNGNTLITESDPGYVLEVTPEGETVWEFANPQVNDKGERSAIWRMVRFRREELPFLEKLGL